MNTETPYTQAEKALTVSKAGLTEAQYVAEVKSLPRAEVTSVYAELYRDAADITWPYTGDGETLKDGVEEGGEILLSDLDIERFAEQDYYDGPTNWAFLPAEEA